MSGCTVLTSLNCNDNQLISLDVSKNTALTSLYCYENQIKGIKMDTLVSTLPMQNQAKLYIINPSSAQEGNICTKDQVKIARKRGWRVYKSTGGYYDGSESEDHIIIKINEENFPDENFRAFLKEQCGGDTILTEKTIKSITTINVCSRNIKSLKGIELFTALEYLDCSYNQLTSLDVSNNTTLTRLECYQNQLTSLDVSKNTALKELFCYDNKIKGEAMDALVESLPNQSSAEMRIIDLSSSSEKNVCTTIQVNTAKEKGWRVLTSSGNDYEGSSDPSGIHGITLDDNVNTSIYDLNGRRLKKPGKGISIINGKKYVKK
jgi:V8-like Glu-specific endopeptidase